MEAMLKFLLVVTMVLLLSLGIFILTNKPPLVINSPLSESSPSQVPNPPPPPVTRMEPPPPPSTQLLEVPFTSQAPFGEWSDPRHQDGCEEAAVLMATSWVRGRPTLSREEAKKEILALSSWQSENYGEYRDTSAADTFNRLLKNYYQYQTGEIKEVTSPEDIVAELAKGHVIITPMNGRALENPHFTAPGPERHMVLVKGYDLTTNEFITNDPGIRQGEGYRYPFSVFFAAIRDYRTGYHLPIIDSPKPMIIVKKTP